MDIAIIGMPLNLGCDRDGVELAPKYLRSENLLSHLFNRHTPHDLGDLIVPHRRDIQEAEMVDRMKYIHSILAVNKELSNTVYNVLHTTNYLPIIIGGDHALSWGSIAGVKREYADISVFYIDAHGDFNTAATSESHNVHGMHMAYLMGFGDQRYVDFPSPNRKLAPENVFFYGTRSLDAGEVALAKTACLHIRTTQEIQQEAIETTCRIIEAQLLRLKHIHLSIDLDVLDPKIAPGTGVPEKDGLTLPELQAIITTILHSKKVVSIDFVEYNPLLDATKKTESAVCAILSTINNAL